MATVAETPAAAAPHRTDLAFSVRVRSLFARVQKFFAPPEEEVDEPDLTVPDRVRKFLWLSSGLFSAASFMIPAIGYLAFGSIGGAATNFPAAVVSACLFGFASLLHFGPDTA